MTEALMNVVAFEKLQQVETLVAKLAAAEGQLELGYASLAYLLSDVSEHRYWDGTYKSFGEFINHISTAYNIGKSQLYNYLATARDLGDSVTEDQLNDMGISKALALREAKNATGSIPSNILTAALDPKVTVKDMKKLLFDAKILVTPEDGTWCNMDFSCYYTPEQKATVNDACNAARHEDPPIAATLPEHIQFKEILLRFSMSFLSDHGDSVVEGGRGL